jgi:hypothetical protein
MMSSLWLILFVFGFLIFSYYIYKKLKHKKMVHKDYNRKFSRRDRGLQKDLQTLRNQLFESEDPAVNNEILNKIYTIIKSQNPKK